MLLELIIGVFSLFLFVSCWLRFLKVSRLNFLEFSSG